MENNPESRTSKISVIIPIYNAENHLERTLDSIVNQTIFDQLEVILINDGSTDRTEEICQTYAKKYGFKYIYQKNAGSGAARNRGIDSSSGDYLSFPDSDDTMTSDFYERLLMLYLEKNVDLSEVAMDTSNKNGKPFLPKRDYSCDDNKKILLDFILGKGLYFNNASKLYKRELVGDIRFDLDCVGAEDFCFNFELLQKVNKVYSDKLTPRYYYYYTEGSITDSTKGVTEKQLTFFNGVEKVLSLTTDIEIEKALKVYAVNQYLHLLERACRNKQNNIISELKSFISKYDQQLSKNEFIPRSKLLELRIVKHFPYLQSYYRALVRNVNRFKLKK